MGIAESEISTTIGARECGARLVVGAHEHQGWVAAHHAQGGANPALAIDQLKALCLDTRSRPWGGRVGGWPRCEVAHAQIDQARGDNGEDNTVVTTHTNPS